MIEDCCKRKQMAREKFINEGMKTPDIFILLPREKKKS
jgi:hypothetical protein